MAGICTCMNRYYGSIRYLLASVVRLSPCNAGEDCQCHCLPESRTEASDFFHLLSNKKGVLSKDALNDIRRSLSLHKHVRGLRSFRSKRAIIPIPFPSEGWSWEKQFWTVTSSCGLFAVYMGDDILPSPNPKSNISIYFISHETIECCFCCLLSVCFRQQNSRLDQSGPD